MSESTLREAVGIALFQREYDPHEAAGIALAVVRERVTALVLQSTDHCHEEYNAALTNVLDLLDGTPDE